MAVIEQDPPTTPDPAKVLWLIDHCITTTRNEIATQQRALPLHEEARAEWAGKAAPVDRWASIHVDELVPGDRIISGGVECDVIQTGWVGVGMRLVVVDLPGVHGGTYPARYEWAADAGVQVREDLHRRLVDEITQAEPMAEVLG